MIRTLLSAVATVGFLGFAFTASAADYPKQPEPPRNEYRKPVKKEYKIEKKIDAVKECKDRYGSNGYDAVYLNKGVYEVEFDSHVYSPKAPYKYVKLDRVYVDYKNEDYENDKEKIKDKNKKYKNKEYIEIPYNQEVKIYFKDKICKDNQGYGKIEFEYKDKYEDKEEVRYPPKNASYPPKKYDDDNKYDDDKNHHDGGEDRSGSNSGHG